MHQSVQRLRQEQRNLRDLLDVLERQLKAVQRGLTPDYDLMRAILHYLTRFPDHYHHPYEDRVCERLARRAPQTSGWSERFQEAHHQLAILGLECLQRVEDVLDGVALTRAALSGPGLEYVAAYLAHLQREEQEIHAAADGALTPADWLLIDTGFYWRDDPLFGPRIAAEYQALHDRIAIETSARRVDESGQELCGACAV